MPRDMWYEQRLDTRSKPQPAHVLDLLQKPAETAVDKALRELQDGPVRDLLRLAFHHGVRGSKPDIPSRPDAPETELDELRTELLKLKTEARSLSSLSFSLLSEIHSSRRNLMWGGHWCQGTWAPGQFPLEPRGCRDSAPDRGSP